MSSSPPPRAPRGGSDDAPRGLEAAVAPGGGGPGGGFGVRVSSSDAALVSSAVSTLRARAARPALCATSRELRDALAAAAAAAAGVPVGAAPAPPAAAAAVRLPPLPPPTLEDVAPHVAQTGHHGAADVLAQTIRAVRSDERTWRAISRLAHGPRRHTRLAWAARRGDVPRCAFLVEHGARVAVRDAGGRSPLGEALAGGHVAAAAFLRAHGAEEDFGGALVATWGPEAEAGVRGELDGVLALASLPGALLAVGHESGAIRVRSTVTGAVTATLAGHVGAVHALAVLPGGRLAGAPQVRARLPWATGLALGTCARWP